VERREKTHTHTLTDGMHGDRLRPSVLQHDFIVLLNTHIEYGKPEVQRIKALNIENVNILR